MFEILLYCIYSMYISTAALYVMQASCKLLLKNNFMFVFIIG